MDALKARLEEKGAKVNLQFTTRERQYFEQKCGFTDEEIEIFRMRSRGFSIVKISMEMEQLHNKYYSISIIKKVCKMIDEELEVPCEYIRCAIKYKEDYPSLSKALYTICEDEMEHVASLHSEIVKLIESHRREHGEPPEAMMAVYDYLHEQQIEKANRVRMYQDQYKSY